MPRAQSIPLTLSASPLPLHVARARTNTAGVYDIAKHYAFEKERGVHSLSTMLPAMGGFRSFAAQSPSVILAAALQGAAAEEGEGCGAGKQEQQQEQDSPPPACSFYETFPLAGESISHRIGGCSLCGGLPPACLLLLTASHAAPEPLTQPASPIAAPTTYTGFDRGSQHYQAAEAGLVLQSLAGMSGVPRLPLAAATRLPPTVLMSSCSDTTVPWLVVRVWGAGLCACVGGVSLLQLPA